MQSAPTDTAIDETAATAPQPELTDDTVLTDLLVEEISIDGMCGVY